MINHVWLIIYMSITGRPDTLVVVPVLAYHRPNNAEISHPDASCKPLLHNPSPPSRPRLVTPPSRTPPRCLRISIAAAFASWPRLPIRHRWKLILYDSPSLSMSLPSLHLGMFVSSSLDLLKYCANFALVSPSRWVWYSGCAGEHPLLFSSLDPVSSFLVFYLFCWICTLVKV
jgi:hypothetical protein